MGSPFFCFASVAEANPPKSPFAKGDLIDQPAAVIPVSRACWMSAQR
jgi:hypothetical protein